MSFRDLDEFFDDCLRLPIGGTTYVIEPPDADTGLWAKKKFTLGMKILAGRAPAEDGDLDDAEEEEMYVRLMGDVWEQMRADGVNWQRMKRAGATTFYWVVGETDSAERMWETGSPVDPELQARVQNRADRRKATRGSGSPKSANTAAGQGTKSRASTRGTNRRATAT